MESALITTRPLSMKTKFFSAPSRKQLAGAQTQCLTAGAYDNGQRQYIARAHRVPIFSERIVNTAPFSFVFI